MCAEPEAGAVSRAVVELGEVEDIVSEGVVKERDVLCLVCRTEGKRWRHEGCGGLGRGGEKLKAGVRTYLEEITTSIA